MVKFSLLIFVLDLTSGLVTFPTAPHTDVTEKGEIKYSEVVRENVRKLEAYVEEMASGDTVSGAVNIQKVQDDVLKLSSVVKALPEISNDQKNHIKTSTRVLFALCIILLTCVSLELEHAAVAPHPPSSTHKSRVLLPSPPSPPIRSHFYI